jgi:hypothetical protein
MLYSLVKPVLFAVDAELAHEVSLDLLEQFHSFIPQVKIDHPVEVMGLQFPNRVGLADFHDSVLDLSRSVALHHWHNLATRNLDYSD